MKRGTLRGRIKRIRGWLVGRLIAALQQAAADYQDGKLVVLWQDPARMPPHHYQTVRYGYAREVEPMVSAEARDLRRQVAAQCQAQIEALVALAQAPSLSGSVN
jgi:hypothetical protein